MLIEALLLVLTLLAILIFVWVRKRRYDHDFFKRLGIPYVQPHLIYGSNHELRDSTTTSVEVYSRWVQKYGKVFGYFSGGRPTLVITDLDIAKEILIKEFHKFSNRPKLIIGAYPVTHTVVGLRDQRWKEVRSLLAPTFSMAKMKLMAGIMNEKIDELLDILEENDRKNLAVDWYATSQGLTLDVICACALALKSKCQKDTNDALLKSVRGFLLNAWNVFINAAIYFPFLGSVMTFVNNKLAFSGKMTQMIVGHLKEVIKIRRKNSNSKTVDVLQLMLDASETIIEEKLGKDGLSGIPQRRVLSDDEIIANAWVFLLGGFETTANAITFTSYLLAKNKDVQLKLYEEIKSLVPETGSNISYEQVAKMTYLDQVFSESLRLYPPVVNFITRESAEDTEICGIKIPKDTGILFPVWDIHRDPELWPEPENFDPDRFSPDSKASSDRHPMAYMPFGAGPRNCVGMRFGQLEAKLAIARIVLNFELEISPKTVDPPALIVPTVAINPQQGMLLRAKRRSSNH